MNLKRTVVIVAIGGALLAWLAGAATSNRSLAPAPAVRSTPIETRGAELANEIARLHERLRPSATLPQTSRNLFAFHAAPARPGPAAPVPPRPAIVDAPPPTPALPPLKLAGIAEDEGKDGPVRTAIISADGQLFMAKEGEAVTARYKVVKITPDVVELVDVTDNTVRRLALR